MTFRDAPPAAFAVIGDPVSHSLSPKMQNAALRALGRSEEYVALQVGVGQVSKALDHLKSLGYIGVNVTVPHKAEAFGWVNDVDDQARSIGVINTIDLARKEGRNTDAPGFVETLNSAGMSPPAQVLLLGAGGSARAITVALDNAGYKLRLWNRTPQRAIDLRAELGVDVQLSEDIDLSGVDIIVNSTSSSLAEQHLPVDWSQAKPDALAYDLMYREGLTPFVERAQAHGLRTLDGKALLVAQGALSLEYWLGIEAPRDVMATAIA